MKTIPLIGIALIAASAAYAQSTIFQHTFDGSDTTPLNGTAVDVGSGNWSVNGFTGDGPDYIYQDGDVATRGAALLAYTFTTGVYELTGTITAGSLNVINFSTVASAPANTYYAQQEGSFGLRSSGDFEFFEFSNQGVNDGGNLSDYGIGGETTGTLRMRLDWDDTTNIGTVLGYYTPQGGSEVQIDLDDQTPGINGNTISPGADLLGVGMTFQLGSYSDFSLTSIPEPSTYAFIAGILGIALVGRRRLQGRK